MKESLSTTVCPTPGGDVLVVLDDTVVLDVPDVPDVSGDEQPGSRIAVSSAVITATSNVI